jgi:hypothetical protein
LSAGASPPDCFSFAGWFSHCLLLRASALRHLLSRSRRTRPSSTLPLCSCQLVVALHLFTPPPPLDAPPSHDWLCCRHRLCAGVFAVVAITIVTLVTSRQAGVIVLVIVVVNVRRHRRRCCIPSRRCHGHRHRRRRLLRHCHHCWLRRPLHRRHCRRCVVDVVVARRAVTIIICEGCKKVTWLNGLFNTYQFVR